MCAALGWGAMSMIQAATHSFGGILAVRLLIGIFEAAFSPGVALYLVRITIVQGRRTQLTCDTIVNVLPPT